MGINGKVRGDKEEVLWGKDRGGGGGRKCLTFFSHW